jgi:hypothetical protein
VHDAEVCILWVTIEAAGRLSGVRCKFESNKTTVLWAI